jgi:fused signal recognition particle receptor
LFKNFTKKLSSIFISKKIDATTLLELEELLLISDVGMETVDKILDKLKIEKFSDSLDIIEIKTKLGKIILDIIEPFEVKLPKIDKELPLIIFCIGVNGSGKTTTIAKLANHYKAQGYKVILGAADTFRAAATQQLSEWANQMNLEIITGADNSDPASVVYQCVENTINNNFNIGIIDTAGRLQNRSDLMEQLKKMNKVIQNNNLAVIQKTIMVVDSTTGQSTIKQVQEFAKYVSIDGLILSKFDGSAIGGTIVSIINQLKIPIIGIGTGEKKEDLEEFDSNKFIIRYQDLGYLVE